MDGLMPIILKTIICLGLAYWVYQDSRKNKIKYGNFWVILSFVFPPGALVYYLYKKTGGSVQKLTFRQKLDAELRKQTEQNKKTIAEQRKAMELLQQEEQEKNKLALEEIEKIQEERLALKKQRLEELKQERLQQQEEIANKLRVSREAANKLKMFDE
ncbi:MAG TPA: hypothetical protein IAB06_06150 [Candidatus Avacidaminococcus intestinavium]|uniref:Uncharacterized protein n=1 Tax=Candidatus Avacidaminococcus intestinavium TaxID=2840684 RepID=A0A9D1SLG4_9FIRM|nr:hypothetical protein [Candidatus Avacidaminococcus intestinavium]